MAGNDRSLAVVVTANLSQMRETLKQADSVIATTSAAMKRMGESYSGASTIANANAAMQAVKAAGGATTLTEAEQRKLNATLTEGIAKYQALGKQAPADMLKLRDATAQVAAPVDTLGSKLKGLAGTLGLAFGATAVLAGVKSLATSTLTYAENISDLSKKMAVSAEAAQRWQFAAKQSGASLDDVDKAVRKLSVGLDGGDKSVRLALDAAGLSFDKIRAMKPEEAFNASVTAIAKIENPMTQARVALELFGKAGAELLPSIRNGFDEVARSATVMSDKTIERLDKAKDSWERLWTNVTIWTGEAVAFNLEKIDRLTFGFNAWKTLATEGWNPERGMGAALGDIAPKVGPLTASLANLTNTTKLTREAAIALMDAAKEESDALERAREKALALAKAHQANVDVLTGKALAREVSTLAREVADAGKQGGLSAHQYEQLGKKLDDIKSKGAVLPNILHNIWLNHERLNPSINLTTDAYKNLAAIMKLTAVPLGAPLPLPINLGPDDWKKMLGLGNIGPLGKPPAADFGFNFKSSLLSSLEGLGGIIIGAIQGGGSVGKAAFGSIGLSLGEDLGKTIAMGIGGSLGKALGSFAGPLGAIAGSLLGGVMDKLFGKNQGREDAKSFAATFGGFDALREKMLELEGGGEQLWIALTQNTKGPEQVAATIRQITAAFDALKGKQDELADGFTGPEGARGFPTKAQLEKAAQEAKDAYDFMMASGLYTTDVLEQAWDSWQSAAIAAGDKTAARMKALGAEMLTLQEAIAEELPEYDADGVRIYGVIEQQNIDRLAVLEKEKQALIEQGLKDKVRAEEEATDAIGISAKKAMDETVIKARLLDDQLRLMFAKGYEIPVGFKIQGLPNVPGVPSPGGPGSPGPSAPKWAPNQTTIIINNPQVRNDRDLREITRQIVRAIPGEVAFIGGISR